MQEGPKKQLPESQGLEEPVAAHQLPERPPDELPYPLQEAVSNTTSVAGTALFWVLAGTPVLLVLAGGWFVFGWGILLVLGGILAGAGALMRNPPARRLGRSG